MDRFTPGGIDYTRTGLHLGVKFYIAVDRFTPWCNVLGCGGIPTALEMFSLQGLYCNSLVSVHEQHMFSAFASNLSVFLFLLFGKLRLNT